MDKIPIENDGIISLFRKLYLNKANGSDGISGQMILFMRWLILPLFRTI